MVSFRQVDMAPKQEKSKKAVKEKEKRVIEDLTFGLKNKNKSSKVKQFIERAEKSGTTYFQNLS